ncbi:hypothetical protein GCM10022222_76810 [Amycolatopsis ultiminotia]|uniref:DUF6292 domain-containing protein n=1 Tax=Amycolatopsis ultiminotia TaxID=543629 RepID=A0ABP6YDN8_9PSEU
MLLSGPDRPMALPSVDDPQSLRRALVAYVHEVAASVGVSVACTSCEVADTVTAYVALNGRSPRFPGRDLMLLWSARQGWTLSVETAPAESPLVVARLGGDLTPVPDRVRRFVTETLGAPDDVRPAIPVQAVRDHSELRERLEACVRRS